MSRRYLCRKLLLAPVVVLALSATALAQSETSRTYYQVRGTSTQSPNEDRQWSESYEDRASAEARMVELQRDYAQGGLLESSPDKPINLHIVEFVENVRQTPVEPRRPQPSAPAESAQGGRGAPPQRRHPVAGTWIGTEGWSDTSYLRFVFRPGGQALAYDELGLGVWTGTWRADANGSVAIQLTSPNRISYSGQIRGNVLAGTAINISTGGTCNWSVTRQ